MECLNIFGSAVVIGYSGFVFVFWYFLPKMMKRSQMEANNKENEVFTLPEDLKFSKKLIEYTTPTKIFIVFINFMKLEFILSLIRLYTKLIRYTLSIRGRKTDNIFALWRMITLYFVMIPVPAAFMPPVGIVQRQADLQLMIALLLIILSNAIGDLISVRISLRNFEHVSKLNFSLNKKNGINPDDILENGRQYVNWRELKIYGVIIFDLLLAVGVLCLVLAFS